MFSFSSQIYFLKNILHRENIHIKLVTFIFLSQCDDFLLFQAVFLVKSVVSSKTLCPIQSASVNLNYVYYQKLIIFINIEWRRYMKPCIDFDRLYKGVPKWLIHDFNIIPAEDTHTKNAISCFCAGKVRNY